MKGFKKNVSGSILCAWMLTCSFLLISTISYAAEKSAAEEEVYTLKPIIVTAQKQEENIQEVPASISVITGLNVKDKKIEGVNDLGGIVPNLMIFNHGMSGMNAPIMRGISAYAESYKVSTGLYMDGVPILSPIGFENGLLDVERIEVLRGPQSTIYGKGAEVGAINIVTKRPGDTFEGEVTGEIGTWMSSEAGNLTDSVMLRASGPLVQDKLYFSLAGKFAHEDGFIKNILDDNPADDRERWLGDLRLFWTPTEDLDIVLNLSGTQFDDGGNHYGLGPIAETYYGPSPGDRLVSSNGDASNKSSDMAQSLKVTYDINEAFSLTSITAHRLYNFKLDADYDYTPDTAFHISRDDEHRKITQELRLNYSKDKLKGLLGLYFDDDNIDIHIDQYFPGGQQGLNSRKLQGNTYAVFGNLTLPLTEKLVLNAGMRYEMDKQKFKINTTGEQTEDSWNEFTPKLALNYHMNPEIMTYFSVAKGYRSGGYTALENNPEHFSYDPEELWSYEIGTKTSFFDNRLMVNGSVYYMDITDMQVLEKTTIQVTSVTNASKATGIGAELEVIANVAPGVTLNGSVGYNDLTFDEFTDRATGESHSGNKNPWAPEFTFNLGGQYRHTSGLFARADLIGYGETYFDSANEYSRDPYMLVNAKVGYESERFDVYLYAKNLFDTEYDAVGAYDGFYTIYSVPGNVGIQASIRF